MHVDIAMISSKNETVRRKMESTMLWATVCDKQLI